MGLPLTFIGTALLAHCLAGLAGLQALLLGAVLAPTDPVFAAAIVRREDIALGLRPPEAWLSISNCEQVQDRRTGGCTYTVISGASSTTMPEPAHGVQCCTAGGETPAMSLPRANYSLAYVGWGLILLLRVFLDLTQPARAVAQSSPAGVLTAAIERHLAVLRADSMRDTAGGVGHSAGLERTAHYVAAQFAKLGLRPGVQRGGDSLWFQHYPLPGQRRVDFLRAQLRFAMLLKSDGKTVLNEGGSTMTRAIHLSFDTAAYFSVEGPPPIVPEIAGGGWILNLDSAGSARVVLVSGHYTAAAVPDSGLQGSIVLYLPSADVDAATRRQVLARLYAVSEGVVLIRADDPAGFADRLRAARGRPVPLVDRYLQLPALSRQWSWIVEVRADAVRDFLAIAGVDLDAIYRTTTPALRPLPTAGIWLTPNVAEAPDSTGAPVTAPNVVAVLEGADSTLRQEYVVVSSPLDVRSSAREEPAGGVAGLLALAEALRPPGVRPRRSLVFLASSGTPAGAWGSYFFVSFKGRVQLNLGNTLLGLVANLSLDFLGQPTESGAQSMADSGVVIVTGTEAVELPHAPAWLAALHGELGLRVREEPTSTAMSGAETPSALDYLAFLQNAIPSVYLHGGLSARRVVPGAAIDPAYASRVTGLAFYLVADLANAPISARLSDAGRRALGQGRDAEP